jgi:predicted Zn-dependent protease
MSPLPSRPRGGTSARSHDTQSYFHDVAESITALLHAGEIFTCSFSGEESDFVRFSRGEIGQAGHVVQQFVRVDLIEGRRHASATLSLGGDLAGDRERLRMALERLREMRAYLPEDPFLSYATEVRSSSRLQDGQLPERDEAVARIRAAGQGADLVGIYAAGSVHRGFANSLGQRNWYGSESFNLDWSYFHSADKAVKAAYAGFAWSSGDFSAKVEQARRQLDVLARPARRIAPGRYRVFLAPAALNELVTLLGWGGFGLRAHRTKTTPLLRMVEEGARLHGSLSITENTRDGLAPGFQENGFLRPDEVPLVRGGAYASCLVSPRSAIEYGVPTNGATASEMPTSVDIGAGDLPADRVLHALGTGIYVGNLWYSNFSDRTACRTTGMTRFATFWVDNGEIQAPLEVMRFDETLYRMLGENLIGLTRERETILDPGTYHERSMDSARLPGALIDDFTLTL